MTSPVEIHVVRKQYCNAWELTTMQFNLLPTTDDGTLIVSTQSDGVYFLFKGKPLLLWCVCNVIFIVRPLDSLY